MILKAKRVNIQLSSKEKIIGADSCNYVQAQEAFLSSSLHVRITPAAYIVYSNGVRCSEFKHKHFLTLLNIVHQMTVCVHTCMQNCKQTWTELKNYVGSSPQICQNKIKEKHTPSDLWR